MRLALASLCISTAAFAQELVNPDANRHFHAGLAAFGSKDFVTARGEFSAAYQLEATPSILWSWAQAERMSGRCADALPLYKKYRETASTPERIRYTDQYIAECERALPVTTKPWVWYKDPLVGGLGLGGVVGIGVGVTLLV